MSAVLWAGIYRPMYRATAFGTLIARHSGQVVMDTPLEEPSIKKIT